MDSEHFLNIEDVDSWLQEHSLTIVEQEKTSVVEVKGINYAYGKGDSRVQVLFNNYLYLGFCPRHEKCSHWFKKE